MENDRHRYDRERGRQRPPGEPGRRDAGERPPGGGGDRPPGRQPGPPAQGQSSGRPGSPRGSGTGDEYGQPGYGTTGQSGGTRSGGQPRTGPPPRQDQGGRSGRQPGSQQGQQPPGGQQQRTGQHGGQQPPQGQGTGYGAGGQAPPAGQSRQPAGGPQDYGGQQARQGSQSQPGGAGGRRWEQPPVRPVTVEDVVQMDVVTVQPDTPARTVVASMAEHDVGTTVVVDGERAVGIITDRMVALALETQPDVTALDARDLMTEDLVTVTTGASVDEVLSVLAEEGIRRVPVVDDGGRLQGIVSLDDLVVLVAGELDRIRQVVETQSPRF